MKLNCLKTCQNEVELCTLHPAKLIFEIFGTEEY